MPSGARSLLNDRIPVDIVTIEHCAPRSSVCKLPPPNPAQEGTEIFFLGCK